MKKIEVGDVLQGAAKVLEKNEWTTCALACDTHGEEIDPKDDEAVGFCVMGAIERCLFDNMLNPSYADHVAEAVNNYCTDLPYYNDFIAQTKQEVQDFLLEIAETFEARTPIEQFDRYLT